MEGRMKRRSERFMSDAYQVDIGETEAFNKVDVSFAGEEYSWDEKRTLGMEWRPMND